MCTLLTNRHTHEYAASAHSGSDEYYYYDTEDEGCDCCSHTHSYVECDHAPGECDCEEESEEQSHHHHHHHHHGEIDSDADEYQYEDRHTCTHDHQARLPPDEEAAFASAQPGDEIPNDSHVEANGASGATNGMDQPHSNGDGRKRLAEDPEKMVSQKLVPRRGRYRQALTLRMKQSENSSIGSRPSSGRLSRRQ